MTCQECREKLSAMVIDDVNPSTELRGHLEGCAGCEAEYRELKRMWVSLAEVTVPEPSASMQDRFGVWLAAEAKASHQARRPSVWAKVAGGAAALWGSKTFWQIAAVTGCLALGFVVGNSHTKQEMAQEQVAQMRQEMDKMRQLLAVSMMQQQSASQRLQGVSLSTKLRRPDTAVVNRLIETLKTDDSINVRLAAADSLANVADEPEVRKQLIEALGEQDSPTMQLSLLSLLMDSKDKALLPVARKIAEDPKANRIVRQQAQQIVNRFQVK